MKDTMLYIVLPYLAVFSCILFSIFRLRLKPYSYSTLSSQFLETGKLYWGSNAWHYGLIVVFVGHLVAFLFPKTILAINAVPLRLYILEVTGVAGGMLMLFGLFVFAFRRIFHPRVRAVTSIMDLVVLLLLTISVVTGLYSAIVYNWGTSWFAVTLSPYLFSLLTFQPELAYIVDLPHIVKTHVFCAFLLVGVLPFTRLVHVFSFPFHYPFRPYQLVLWNWDRKEIRNPEADEDVPEEEEEWTPGV